MMLKKLCRRVQKILVVALDNCGIDVSCGIETIVSSPYSFEEIFYPVEIRISPDGEDGPRGHRIKEIFL
jgi:hypothetical protein